MIFPAGQQCGERYRADTENGEVAFYPVRVKWSDAWQELGFCQIGFRETV